MLLILVIIKLLKKRLNLYAKRYGKDSFQYKNLKDTIEYNEKLEEYISQTEDIKELALSKAKAEKEASVEVTSEDIEL